MQSRWRNGVSALALALACSCDSRGEPELAVAEDTSPAAPRAAAAGECRVVDAGMPLPEQVRETSGLARSRLDPDVFWTHNDAGNDPVLYALGPDGRLLGRTTVVGAEQNDWEDLAAGPCSGGSCLYVGDIGDNDAQRETIVIYQVPEPTPGAAATRPARALRARFPDGAHDAEALFVLPSGELFLVTKGREGAVAVYRYPEPHRPDQVVTLQRVRTLAPEPADEDDRVTGATASPDGRWVAIRSYRTLLVYPAGALTGETPSEPVRVDLEPLEEGQGESLVLDDDGSVWLSSEAPSRDERPRWSRLRCTLPASGG